MPRVRTGTLSRKNGELRARITVTTTTGTARVWFTLPSTLTTAQANKQLQFLLKSTAGKVYDSHQLDALKARSGSTETVEQFFWSVYTRERSLYRYQLAHWRHHILPVIGELPVRTFGPDDLRRLVARLDGRVSHGALAYDTARVIWTCARKFAADLCGSKIEELRIRNTNPARDVMGPDKRAGRAKQWLYPSELQQFLVAHSTPLGMARWVAVQVYLCCRPSEVFGLQWRHFDLEKRTVRIDQQRDTRTRVVGPTKGREVRAFRLPEVLLGLLQSMRGEPGEFLFATPPSGPALRAALIVAGVTRHELHELSKHSRPLRVHDCRGTGISYLAMAGMHDDAIRERAGHKSFGTTLGYIQRGKGVLGDIGEPFAPLPERLETSDESSKAQAIEGKEAAARIQSVYGAQPKRHENPSITPPYVGVLGVPAGSPDDSVDDSVALEFIETLREHGERALAAQLLFGGQRRGDA